jgi:hypothetical protein
VPAAAQASVPLLIATSVPDVRHARCLAGPLDARSPCGSDARGQTRSCRHPPSTAPGRRFGPADGGSAPQWPPPARVAVHRRVLEVAAVAPVAAAPTAAAPGTGRSTTYTLCSGEPQVLTGTANRVALTSTPGAERMAWGQKGGACVLPFGARGAGFRSRPAIV